MSRQRVWVPIAAVVALIFAAIIATGYGNPAFESSGLATSGTEDVPHNPPPPQVPNPGPTATGSPTPEMPGWLGQVLLGLLIAGVAVLIGVVLWFLLRDRLHWRSRIRVTDDTQARERTQKDLQRAVDEGLADLDIDDMDPRRAVIACWVRLETAAAVAGTARDAGDTSTDLVRRLLAEHAITRTVLDEFAAVYRHARFAPQEVDPTMRERARAALLQVRDELRHPGQATTDAVPDTAGAGAP